MKSRYVVWTASSGSKDNFCVLDDLENVEDDWELTEGVSRLENFPEYAEFSMDAEYKKNVALSDNLDNASGLAIVSRAVKEMIESWPVKKVEYLPVRIFNHKGKIASSDYFVINPLGLQECLDTEKSGCRWSKVAPDEIADVKKIVIDEAQIADDALIFRMRYYTRPILVRTDLAKAITDAGFTGLTWTEVEAVES